MSAESLGELPRRHAALAALLSLLGGLALATLTGCGSADSDGEGGEHDGYPPTAMVRQFEELRAGMAAPRHPSDGGGRAWLELAEGESGAVQAGTSGRWSFVYEAGPLGIQEGGALYFLVPPFWGWSSPQTREPRQLGFTSVESDAEGLVLDARGIPGQPLLIVGIEGRAMAEGEQIRIVYGVGAGGALADRHAERGSPFWFAVDGDGDGVRALIDDCPTVDVLPGPPAKLSAVLGSSAAPGEEVRLTVAVLDPAAAAWVAAQGVVTLEWTAPESAAGLPTELELRPEDRAARSIEFTVNTEGIYRVHAAIELDDQVLGTTSNPLRVAHDSPRVFWADLHGHSNLSDGTGLPEDYFRYARDVASLDVVALSDHDHFGMRFLDANPDMWEQIQAQVEAFQEPGRFVTLPAYEWTNWIHGHRHVLFFGEEGELLSALDPAYENPQQLWDALRGRPAMTLAHHSAGGPVATDWSYAPDPVLEPLTEVMSVHGSSEAADSPARIRNAVEGNFVRDVLDRGVQFGFVGSGDSHDGHPGLAHLSPVYGYRGARTNSPEHVGTGGLAAIQADELTRESVLKAMRARRTWATSGPRILLDVSLQGFPAGTSIPAAAVNGDALLRTTVSGTAGIASMDVIRSGELVERVLCGGRLDVDQLSKLSGLQPGEYVYLRVEQEDGGLAWSSPFYVE